MGKGEPLLNYKNVLESIEKITSEDGLNMAAKRITVSTAGIAKMIKKLGDDEVKFNLALSLHAANDEKRNTIMPINEQNSLKALAEALKYYYAKTKNPVTYEYIIFDGVNDNIEMIRRPPRSTLFPYTSSSISVVAVSLKRKSVELGKGVSRGGARSIKHTR